MHPHSGIYVNSTVPKKLSVAEELEKIEWQMSTQLANLRLLIQEVHRNDISESPAEKMPVGVVEVEDQHPEVELVGNPMSVGRNMNEEY